MTESRVWSRLTGIASDALNVDEADLRPQSSSDNTEGWTSLSHLRLLTRVEKEFGVRFRGSELPQLDTLAKIEVAVMARIA